MIIMLVCMISTLSTQAQEEYIIPFMHGNGSKLLKADRDNSWDANALQWNPTDSLLNTYDAQGRVTQMVYRSFIAPNWNITRIKKTSYNTNGKEHIIIDSLPNSFSISRKYIFTYNTTGQITLIEKQRLNSSFNWIQAQRTQISYTATGKTNTELTEVYINSNWTNDNRTVYTYNAADQNTSVTYETWNTSTSAWVPDGRKNMTYNAAGLVQTKIEQTYITATNTFVNYSKDDYTYNANGKELTDIRVDWNLGTNTWVNKYKYTSVYSTNNRVSTLTVEIGYGIGWQNFQKTFYDYINTDWCNLAKSLSWNTTTAQYDTASRTNFIYDANGYLTKYIYDMYNTSLNTWVNTYEKFYWYIAGPSWPTGIEDVTPRIQLSVFPNPVSNGIVYVNADKKTDYVISNMQGQIVNRGQLLVGSNSIILNLQAGTYIIHAEGASSKIVVQ